MKSTLIVFSLLTVASSSCLAQGKPVKPTDPATTAIAPPTIVDATGKAVGLYSDPYFAIFRYNRAVIIVRIFNRFEGGQRHSAQFGYGRQDVAAFYASADCSGVPFPPDNQQLPYGGNGSFLSGLRPAVFTVASGQVTAHIAASELSTVKSYNSFSVLEQSSEGVLSNQCIAASGSVPGYNIETSVVLPTGPLTVQ